MSFSLAMSFVIKWEGGYVNHPNDPGGETNHGVTKRVYLDYCNKKGLTPKKMRDLKKEDVMPIYKELYWDVIKGDSLPLHIAVCAMDCAVNMGVKVAQRFLSETDQWRQYNQLRIARYHRIIERNPKLEVFRKGWMNRMTDLNRFVESL